MVPSSVEVAHAAPPEWAHGNVVTCLYCAFRADAVEQERMREHYALLHRDRIAAATLYREVLSTTGDVEQAREAANELLSSLFERGPGRYDRRAHA